MTTKGPAVALSSLGVAVIGAGMAGRSHAQAYRSAATVLGAGLPPIRLVAIADINQVFATQTAARYGFERAESSWQAIVDAPDIDAVSIVVGNVLHREIAEALLAAGKHVLCEKPLAPSVTDAAAMVAAAARAGRVAATGFSYRRSPAVAAIREQLRAGAIGDVLHFNGRYWCDYGADAQAPMSWRYQGGLGSGALGDIGSHLIDLAEFLCGPITSVAGSQLPILITNRPKPLGAAVGHAAGVAVSDERVTVTNEDIATFTGTFANGAVGTFSVSRVAIGHPNGLAFEVFGQRGAAAFDLARNAEFSFIDRQVPSVVNGYRTVLTNPEHPYIAGGLAMGFPGVGHGVQEFFTYQARAFLEEIAGLRQSPRCATFADGLHNLDIEQAIVTSAAAGGTRVKVS
jgi:predicted dehydrogenase